MTRPEGSQGPLDAFPEVLRETDVMPWEADPPRWTLEGRDFGKYLVDLGSNNLVAKRRQLVSKNGAQGHYFDPLIAAIDTVLFSREGL